MKIAFFFLFTNFYSNIFNYLFYQMYLLLQKSLQIYYLDSNDRKY